ncbi:hypothetical protein QJS10_CPA05g00971 [Acorus calamus]|uniref:WLM domain-containing protein n=1 Tax=Acorus calamus TaxID=4465 RepID=A0AAV9EQR4_ACOCL|nr:hypothetical protein QJS10_CPA05g00971 [Acorus calamus]
MAEAQDMVDVMVIWRGKKLNVGINTNSNVKDLGEKLHKLTGVQPDTMRLFVPNSVNKSTKLITPFSIEHLGLSIQQAGILEGKPVRMMGVFEDEVKEVSQDGTRPDQRILGFEEEEKRLRQRSINQIHTMPKLPQGTYVFCDFRTLDIPGIKLNPPASEALRRMHMLASDPGIIAIMNKHCWRVGIMTELAPVGYVGVSPKCILGFNKNQGEEISLRLRTDDLKGFRKYESIKKTLLHELAHMVYSEHDTNFFALLKQLNHEAETLDWTKSRGHTLSGIKTSNFHQRDFYYGDDFLNETSASAQKLGGKTISPSLSARASSVEAAYSRLESALNNSIEGSQMEADTIVHEDPSVAVIEPDPDDSVLESDPGYPQLSDNMQVENLKLHDEPDHDQCIGNANIDEPDPDDSATSESMEFREEPDPDDSEEAKITSKLGIVAEPDPDDSVEVGTVVGDGVVLRYNNMEPDPDDSQGSEMLVEPDPDENVDVQMAREQQMDVQSGEPDPDDTKDLEASLTCKTTNYDNQELHRIEEPVSAICARLQKAIEMLKNEASPVEAASALQTLFKIIGNVIRHPNEMKYRRLRKANPLLQRNVVNYKAAMEVLSVVGFQEDVVANEVGMAEAYIVLKRNDPGLLWLAKSSLEMCIA